MIKKITISSLVIACINVALAQKPPDKEGITEVYFMAKVTAQVIDEQGDPIENANVNLRFSHHERYRDGYNDFHGLSDEKGKFSGESEVTGPILIIAEKEGFYRSQLSYQPTDWSEHPKVGQKLEPWNPTIPIILKKIGNPIPLIVRTVPVSRFVPSLGRFHGFDMLEYDWVKPYGDGNHTDLLIRANMEVTDEFNYTADMEIHFPNENDGWIPLEDVIGIESELRYPREAPHDGYRNEPMIRSITVENGIDKQILAGGHPYGYFMRFRTSENSEGRVKSAHYALFVDRDPREINDKRRLHNPITFGMNPSGRDVVQGSGVFFTMFYYLNPNNNDRNLEFDRDSNLLRE